LRKFKSLTSEHDIQKQIVKFLRLMNILVFELDCMSGLQFFSHQDYRRYTFVSHHKAMGYEKGQPDLLMVLPERVIFLEVKKAGAYQGKEQKVIQKKIEELKREYYVVRSLEDVKKIFS